MAAVGLLGLGSRVPGEARMVVVPLAVLVVVEDREG